jgi:riboflavin biosynthesis pyrimidine reductase
VLCEGGPKVNSALLAEGLVDELFLTVAPTLVGGTPSVTLVRGPLLGVPAELELVWCLEAGGFLFLRYALRRGDAERLDAPARAERRRDRISR